MEPTVGLVVRIEAKPEKADAVAEFLAGALPLAEAEERTIVWYALRTGPTTFWVVDSFPDEAGRTTHLEGEIAAALMASADELLSEAPEIMHADVLAAKG